MKNNNTKYIVFALLTALGLVILLFYLFYNPPVNWQETYRDNKTQPYDTHLFKEITKTYFGEENFHESQNFAKDSDLTALEGVNVIYFEDFLFIDSASIVKLFSFIEKGNTVLIFSKDFRSIYAGLGINTCYKQVDYMYNVVESSKIYPFLLPGKPDTATVASHYFQGIPEPYDWKFFADSSFCEADIAFREMGKFRASGEDYTNFLSLSMGKGKLLLHHNPLVFSNFNLREEPILDYTSGIFENLQDGDIYWNEQLFDWNQNSTANTPQISESPLRYILSEPSLRWAWYIWLAAIILYALVNSKRKQKVMPLISAKENLTAGYVDTISRLYFIQKEHHTIVKHQEELLLSFLRNKYHLNTRSIDKDFIAEVCLKTGINPEFTARLFDKLNRYKHVSSLSDEELAKIDSLLTQFYTNCK